MTHNWGHTFIHLQKPEEGCLYLFTSCCQCMQLLKSTLGAAMSMMCFLSFSSPVSINCLQVAHACHVWKALQHTKSLHGIDQKASSGCAWSHAYSNSTSGLEGMLKYHLRGNRRQFVFFLLLIKIRYCKAWQAQKVQMPVSATYQKFLSSLCSRNVFSDPFPFIISDGIKILSQNQKIFHIPECTFILPAAPFIFSFFLFFLSFL